MSKNCVLKWELTENSSRVPKMSLFSGLTVGYLICGTGKVYSSAKFFNIIHYCYFLEMLSSILLMCEILCEAHE